jgi:hypothetical protein
MPGFQQIHRHRQAHGAKTDKGNPITHVRLRSLPLFS